MLTPTSNCRQNNRSVWIVFYTTEKRILIKMEQASLSLPVILVLFLAVGPSSAGSIDFTPKDENHKDKLRRLIEQPNVDLNEKIVQGTTDSGKCQVTLIINARMAPGITLSKSKVNSGLHQQEYLADGARNGHVSPNDPSGYHGQNVAPTHGAEVHGTATVICHNPSNLLPFCNMYPVSFMSNEALTSLQNYLPVKLTFIIPSYTVPEYEPSATGNEHSNSVDEPISSVDQPSNVVSGGGLRDKLQLKITNSVKKVKDRVQEAAADTLELPRIAIASVKSTHPGVSDLCQDVHNRISMKQQKLRGAKTEPVEHPNTNPQSVHQTGQYPQYDHTPQWYHSGSVGNIQSTTSEDVSSLSTQGSRIDDSKNGGNSVPKQGKLPGMVRKLFSTRSSEKQ